MNGRYHFTWVRFPNIYLQILPQTVGVWLPIKDLPRGNSSACTPSCPPTLLYTPSCPPTLLCRVVVMFWCYVPLLYVLLCRRGASCRRCVLLCRPVCAVTVSPLITLAHTTYTLITHSLFTCTTHTLTTLIHSTHTLIFSYFFSVCIQYYCVVHTHTHTHTHDIHLTCLHMSCMYLCILMHVVFKSPYRYVCVLY